MYLRPTSLVDFCFDGGSIFKYEYTSDLSPHPGFQSPPGSWIGFRRPGDPNLNLHVLLVGGAVKMYQSPMDSAVKCTPPPKKKKKK